MSQDENLQEAKAAAEERDQVLEAANENDGVDMSAVQTPVDSQSAAGKPIKRDEESAKEADELNEDTAETNDSEEVSEEPKTTKAGKRSAKAQREAEAEDNRKAAAAERKDEDAPAKPKIVHTPNPRNRHGKNYLAARDLIDRDKQYEIPEGVELIKQTSKVKFDASVELHINLGVDPRQADQAVRSTVVLPHGTGKKLRVAVLASTDKLDDAKNAGADIVSDGDLIDQIDKGKLDFDILVATPDMMGKLSKVAKVLGPRGLMPNPKSGTVTPNVAQAVEQSKAGKVEFRIDKQAIVHMAVGKVSFDAAKLEDNIKTAIDAVMKAKPAAAKGTYVKALSIASSMGPGLKLDIQKAIAASNVKK